MICYYDLAVYHPTFLNTRQAKKKKELDEIRVELMTFPMLRERATNYATRPLLELQTHETE